MRATKKVLKEMQSNDSKGISKPSGYYANRAITIQNGGVPHQFADSIGGCSSNYK